MPHYDYRCLNCGHEFEAFQQMTDPVLEKCEACGGGVERLMSAGSGLIFKGSGFYITDYKNKSKTDEAKKSTADSSSASSSESETKTPVKTEEQSSAPKTDKSAPSKES